MGERHWREIIQRTKINVNFEKDFNFQYLLDIGLDSHFQVCIEVGEKAYREKGIETILDEMQKIQSGVDFKLVDFKTSNTMIVTNFDQAEQVLDQQLSDTQALQVNPFKKPYSDQIDEWLESLLTISNVIEAWQRFQQQWCYLLPIFDSPDINKQLPKETALFKRADATWRTIIQETKIQKNVLKVCVAEGLLDKLLDGNYIFDNILNELKAYLEVKRAKFGRFYFLSNDDLLSILSQTKEIENIQDHLRKVFESIARLEFTQEKRIKAMISVEKEKIDFSKLVDPNMKQVEDWMNEVESAMTGTMRDRLNQAVLSYKSNKRNSWILSNPGQCVLNGSQIHWTQQTEECISNKSLKNQLNFQELQL